MNALILGRVIDPFQKKKILNVNKYIRETDHFGGFVRAFEGLKVDVFISWRVRFIYNGKFQQLFPLIFRFFDFFIKNIYLLRIFDRFLLSLHIGYFCKKKSIDFIFTELNGSISPKLIKKLSPSTVVTQWMGVFPDQIHKSVSEVFHEYDYLWCPCIFDEQKVVFKGMDKLFYVGSGYDPGTQYYEYDPKYAYDIAFYGGIEKTHSERLEVLEFIAENYQNFAIYGYGLSNISSHSVIRKFYKGWLEPSDIRKLISSSKIIINLTLDRYDLIKKGFNARLFEVAACNGAVQILKNDSKIFDYFDQSKEVITFKDLDDLKMKIDFLLNDSVFRKDMSNLAFKKVKSYSFEGKAELMLEKIRSRQISHD